MSLRKQLVPKRYRQVIFALRQRRMAERGTPPGLDYEWLNTTLRTNLEVSPISFAYAPLGSYKRGSAYRIWVDSKPNRIRTLVFKDARLDRTSYPAIAGFPGQPGPPEWSVLSNPGDALQPYLPRIYATRDLSGQTHYQYLIEDLAWSHRHVVDDRDAERAIRDLSTIHSALSMWQDANLYTPVVDFGADSALAVMTFAEGALRHFAEATASEVTFDFLKRWNEVDAALQGSLNAVRQIPTRLIHGDFNRRNVFLDTRRRPGMKLVDWEWMAKGPAHADIASMLKRATWDLQKRLVRRFFNANDGSDHLHWEVYLWCRLLRSLMDAALHANQNASGFGHTAPAVAWHLERAEEVLAAIARNTRLDS